MADFFQGVIRSRHEGPAAGALEVSLTAGGRAGGGWVDRAGARRWVAAAGSFLSAETGRCDWTAPRPRAELAERVLGAPDWPWSEGDGGMVAGAVVDGQTCYLCGDPLGSIPLYYQATDHVLSFGTRPLEVALGKPTLDLAGVVETLGLDGCIGERTVLEGVRCLPPGRTAAWSPGRGLHLLPDACPFWRRRERPSPQAAAEVAFERLTAAAERVAAAAGDEPVAVMVGGLDSRLVLELLLAAGVRVELSYTHGRDGISEFDVARRLAALGGVRHLGHPLAVEDCGDPELWRELYRDAGIVAHPQWDGAGRRLVAAGARLAAVGTLGDVVLGGSYYKVSDRERAWLALGLPWVEPGGPFDGSAVVSLVDAWDREIRASGWSVPLRQLDEGIVAAVYAAIRTDLARVLGEYQARGITRTAEARERFLLAHRGRFLILSQERTLARHLPVLSPLLDYDLMRFGYNLDPVVKAERRLLRQLIRRRFPRLAALPVPNSLLPYRYPNLLFVLGKYLRRRRARRNTRRFSRSRGREGSFSEGCWTSAWDPLMRSPEVVDKLAGLFDHPWFDPQATAAFLERIRDGRSWVGTGRNPLRFAELAILLAAVDGQ